MAFLIIEAFRTLYLIVYVFDGTPLSRQTSGYQLLRNPLEESSPSVYESKNRLDVE